MSNTQNNLYFTIIYYIISSQLAIFHSSKYKITNVIHMTLQKYKLFNVEARYLRNFTRHLDETDL